MSLNPLLTTEKEVIRVPGEYLILTRSNCEFDIIIGKDQYKGIGVTKLTSFRVIFVNLDKNTMSKWQGLELPMPLIYDDKFEKPLFKYNKFVGRCKNTDPKLAGTINFTMYITQGSIDVLETVYKDLIGKVRSQQYSKNLLIPFQNSMATCAYHKSFVEPILTKELSTTYKIQPPAYMGAHYLTELMEKTLPGITALEKAAVMPNSGIVPPSSVKDNLISIPPQPIPPPVAPQDGLYPSLLDFDYHGSAMNNAPVNYYQNIGKVAYQPIPPEVPIHANMPPPAPESHYPLCSKCKVECKGNDSMILLCGHYMHDKCISLYFVKYFEIYF